MAPGTSDLPVDRDTGDQVLELARRAKVAYDLGGPLEVTPEEYALLWRTRGHEWDRAVIAAWGLEGAGMTHTLSFAGSRYIMSGAVDGDSGRPMVCRVVVVVS